MEPRSIEPGNDSLSVTESVRIHEPRFNGATLNRTWKENPCAGWIKHLYLASMEPRSIERGNAESCIIGVNAAYASMEPRSTERGNLFSCVTRSAMSDQLNGATLSERGNDFEQVH